MLFRPFVNFKLKIEQESYRFAEHPAAKGITYGQTGRRATVYQIFDAEGNKYALKVFTSSYRTSINLENAPKLNSLSTLPGLKACSRRIIDPEHYPFLIEQYPELEYAVIMPWMEGETWQELVLSSRTFSLHQCELLAFNLAMILQLLENEGAAHCDIAGSNLIVGLDTFSNETMTTALSLSLVDVEEMYSPSLTRPSKLPAGTDGYNHRVATQGLWSADADRFAGAILLTEILTRHDDRIRGISLPEQYFDRAEMQTDCDRYRLIVQVLNEHGDSGAADLFKKAWFSETLSDCPPLAEWAIYLRSRSLHMDQAITEESEVILPDDWTSPEKKRPLLEGKVIILGQSSVGKTSLVQRILHSSFSPVQELTEGIAISQWMVEHNSQTLGRIQIDTQGVKIKLNIWDFGGQEIMYATHQFFLTKRSLYLLVLDSRNSQEQNRVEYWLKIIQSFSDESPVLIVGNKIDQHSLDIDRTGLHKKYPNIVGILETSAAAGIGIDILKQAIVEQIEVLPFIYDLMPESWFSVKTSLEELGNETNFITYDKYLELCAANKISDEPSQRTLIGFLHDLGVVLHFQDDLRLEALGILNPRWVTNGVYKILNSHALFDKKGVLDCTMLDDILNFPEYPVNKRLFIVDMMRKFELCYDIEPDNTFLIPDLLPKDEPFTGEWDDALFFQYHYNVLPSSIISRFIVRMNSYIYKTVWRSGVVLKKGGNIALVKADLEERKIYIAVNGDDHTRRDFLSAIRTAFDSIHKTIIKLEAREKVPMPTHPETVVDYEHLLNLERLSETSFIPEGLRERVNVRELLNGIDHESKRRFTRDEIVQKDIPTYKPNQDSSPGPLTKFLTAVKMILSQPKLIGRFVFDIFGRNTVADSSSILMGWIILVVLIMLVKGFVQINAAINVLRFIWRFFFPAN